MQTTIGISIELPSKAGQITAAEAIKHIVGTYWNSRKDATVKLIVAHQRWAKRFGNINDAKNEIAWLVKSGQLIEHKSVKKAATYRLNYDSFFLKEEALTEEQTQLVAVQKEVAARLKVIEQKLVDLRK